MFGLMNGKVLLKRHFPTEAEAQAWADENSKGRGGYDVVSVVKGATGIVRNIPDSAPPDVKDLITKWARDAKRALPPEDMPGYRQGLVDAARLCEMIGNVDGCAESLLELSKLLSGI